jgi:hypothetical protein
MALVLVRTGAGGWQDGYLLSPVTLRAWVFSEASFAEFPSAK